MTWYEDYGMKRGLQCGSRITVQFEDYGLRFMCMHKDYTEDYEDYIEDYADYNPHNPHNPGCNSQQEK